MLLLKIVASLLVLILGVVTYELVRYWVPLWFHSRRWDPPSTGTWDEETDLRAIYRAIVRGSGCSSVNLEVSEGVDKAPFLKALGELFSESSKHAVSDIQILGNGDKAQLYFAKVKGPMDGTGGVWALSRRQSGNWGIDGPVGLHWTA